MRRSLAATAVVLAVAFSASVSRGGEWFATRWHNFCAITQRNNAWPEAFVPTDRAAARAPFAGCVMAGWRVQNTLSDYHFETDTGALKESGLIKVRRIVTESPPDFRAIFVLRADSAQLTAARLASTQEAAAHYALPGNLPQVGETFVAPRGSPAYYVVDIDRSFQESTPEPRLPQRQSSTSSSSPTGSGS
ncbi:MAG TPA: hypothetical protein VHY20_16210 [Pirellulales bacterium]|jgi:hypothetical protein|nr:hypothetical protein [Pirellulales bacterium]